MVMKKPQANHSRIQGEETSVHSSIGKASPRFTGKDDETKLPLLVLNLSKLYIHTNCKKN